jgi:hypothetical protein
VVKNSFDGGLLQYYTVLLNVTQDGRIIQGLAQVEIKLVKFVFREIASYGAKNG